MMRTGKGKAEEKRGALVGSIEGGEGPCTRRQGAQRMTIQCWARRAAKGGGNGYDDHRSLNV
eukprot:5590522-Pleurochrysis_carterae.AAC.1